MRAPFRQTIQFDVDITESASYIQTLGPMQRRILKPFYKDSTNASETWFVVLGQFTIPAGEYKTPLELGKRLVQQFNAVFGIVRYQYRMHVEQVKKKEKPGRLLFTAESKLGEY